MDQFIGKLRRQQYAFTAGILMACIAVIASRTFAVNATATEFTRGFIDGFETGIFAALLGRLLFLMLRNRKALRDPERLQALHTAETDERLLFIRQKTNAAGMTIVVYGLTLASLIAGNINTTVFFALMGATVFAVLARGFAKLYYRGRI